MSEDYCPMCGGDVDLDLDIDIEYDNPHEMLVYHRRCLVKALGQNALYLGGAPVDNYVKDGDPPVDALLQFVALMARAQSSKNATP